MGLLVGETNNNSKIMQNCGKFYGRKIKVWERAYWGRDVRLGRWSRQPLGAGEELQLLEDCYQTATQKCFLNLQVLSEWVTANTCVLRGKALGCNTAPWRTETESQSTLHAGRLPHQARAGCWRGPEASQPLGGESEAFGGLQVAWLQLKGKVQRREQEAGCPRARGGERGSGVSAPEDPAGKMPRRGRWGVSARSVREPGVGGEEQGGCSGLEAKDKQKCGGGTWEPRLRKLPGRRGTRCYSPHPLWR